MGRGDAGVGERGWRGRPTWWQATRDYRQLPGLCLPSAMCRLRCRSLDLAAPPPPCFSPPCLSNYNLLRFFFLVRSFPPSLRALRPSCLRQPWRIMILGLSNSHLRCVIPLQPACPGPRSPSYLAGRWSLLNQESILFQKSKEF